MFLLFCIRLWEVVRSWGHRKNSKSGDCD